MTNENESPALDRVYAAKTPEELASAYAGWASEYDSETAALGYTLPFMISAWVARYVPKGAGPILDAGCGTGLSGPYLKALGYDQLEGLDFARPMLALAKNRQAYDKLTHAELGKELPWPDGHFATFFSSGVFTEGHAPASGLDELVRITKPGGYAIFTVRDTVLEAGSFPDVFEWLEKAERWRPVEESPFFRAFAVGEQHVLVKTFVFEVL